MTGVNLVRGFESLPLRLDNQLAGHTGTYHSYTLDDAAAAELMSAAVSGEGGIRTLGRG